MKNNIFIFDNCKIKDAMKNINRNNLGTVFIVKKNMKLTGVLTDGDIRRSILKGVDINKNAKLVMRKNFKKIYDFENRSNGLKIINSSKYKIRALPIVNNKNILVDYIADDRLYDIQVYKPKLDGNELKYLSNCISTNWISSNGFYVKKFEQEFSKIHNNRYALSVSSGTTALHLSLIALGIKKSDEVIVPNLTFAAVINAVLYVGAKPVIIDIDPDTWNINENEIKKRISKKTKAIIAVHIFGNPCNINKIKQICYSKNIKLIEDCAEAIGSKYLNKRVGLFGDSSTFSFFGNKTITTGEGGMILFKEKKVYEYAKILRDHGMSKDIKYLHDYIGYNYRLTNMQGAVGCAQLENLNKIIREKISISKTYKKYLKSKIFTFQKSLSNTTNSFWAVVVKINKKNININKLQSLLLKEGVETRTIFYPLSVQKIYKKYFKNKKINNTEKLFRSTIMLPTYSGLTNKDIRAICNVVKNFLNKNFFSA